MKVTVRVADQTFEVEIRDLNARPIEAVIDGEVFEVWPEDGSAPTLPTSIRPARTEARKPAKPASNGHARSSSEISSAVFAPIPGLITELCVHPGDQVAVGQNLCFLEAMKMKNAIRSPREGRIAAIHVSAGQQVAQRSVLMEFE